METDVCYHIVAMNISRGAFLKSIGGLSIAVPSVGCRSTVCAGEGFRVSLNPSTLRGYGLPFLEQVRISAEAGYAGIEPWVKDLHAARADGSLNDAVALARDKGLSFVNGIAFGKWSHPDVSVRAAGMEETKRDMALLAEIGCPMIAASIYGLREDSDPTVPLEDLASRYADLLALGRSFAVRPLLEYWGHSAHNLVTLEDAIRIATLTGDRDAAVLADIYHTYRGGSSFESFRFLSSSTLPVLHVNDYPATPAASALKDADRVYPGDGVAPLGRVSEILRENGVRPWLSLELFNPCYWKATPLATACEGLRKTMSCRLMKEVS